MCKVTSSKWQLNKKAPLGKLATPMANDNDLLIISVHVNLKSRPSCRFFRKFFGKESKYWFGRVIRKPLL